MFDGFVLASFGVVVVIAITLSNLRLIATKDCSSDSIFYSILLLSMTFDEPAWSKKFFYKTIHCSHILQNYWFKLGLVFLYKVTYFLAVLRESDLIICAGYVACGFITRTVILRTVLYVYFYKRSIII